MKKFKYLMMITIAVLAFSVAAAAQQATPTTIPDTSAAQQQQAVRPAVQQPSQNRQASVQRPTKRTNWSKIKTMFE
jgi:Na+-translocating ferredoxin:NAD+ oxidoreductase RnfG subunit